MFLGGATRTVFLLLKRYCYLSLPFVWLVLSIFLLIAIFQQKRKRQHMTSEEWETYFTKLGTDGFLWRLYGCFLPF